MALMFVVPAIAIILSGCLSSKDASAGDKGTGGKASSAGRQTGSGTSISAGHAKAIDARFPDDVNAISIEREGLWSQTRHRNAAADVLATSKDGAALSFSFEGQGLSACLDTLTPPSYGQPEQGLLEVFVDGQRTCTFHPQASANEVVVARGLAKGHHSVRLVHRAQGQNSGCRIRGFRVLSSDSGDLSFTVNGEANHALVDVRAVLTRKGEVVRDTLVRNWLTGGCRVTGLPKGDDYVLELRAMGWRTYRRENISVGAGKETTLPPVYLRRQWDAPPDAFKFPGLGQAVILTPKGTFQTRLATYQAAIKGVRLVRQTGPATISRPCEFEDDPAAAFYFYRQATVKLPDDVPDGLYDMEVTLQAGYKLVSPRCVQVVSRFPSDPVFMTFGHLDTWGQYQAEYLGRLVDLANLIAPDMMLISNEVNPAYASGALYGLDMPCVVTFGNHGVPGPEQWFGEAVGVVDIGPGVSVLNFGRTWDADLSTARSLLDARADVPCKVINAVEHNAPVETFLDKYRVSLLHDAHGPGPRVMKLGATPTIRVGKVDSASFRIVRFKGPVPVSYTYQGDETASIPFNRDGQPPVRVLYEPANDGSHTHLAAQVTNDLKEDFPNGRVGFVLPKGRYRSAGGRIESQVDSDGGKYTVLAVRVDIPATTTVTVRVDPAEDR